MKKLAIALCLAITFATPAWSQDACSQSTKLSNPSRTITSNGTGNLSGSGNTQIHYEMWTEGGSGNKMLWFGADKGGGSAFRAEWNNPNDFLGRIGYYWGNGGKYTTYKNIYVDFNYTRSGRSTAGDYSYIGIYGWTKSPLVEYYVVEDWFGNQWQGDDSPITTNTTGGSEVGSFTVDGSSYKIVKTTKNGKPSIEGNSSNFTQYFSIRQTQRKCGTISLTEHFKKWESLGLTMGNMYEAKFLVEAGGGTGWFDASYIKFSQEDQPRGSGTTPSSSSSPATSSSSKASSSSVAVSSSSKASSSSVVVSSSSNASSSSAAKTQVTTCETPLITYPTSTVPSDPYTACFKYTNDKCYVCKVENEGEFEGNTNTCASGWVWDGTQIASNIENGYWYYEVPCPDDGTPILVPGLSTAGSKQPTYYSLKGEPLGNAKPTKAGIYIFKQGSSIRKIAVR